MKKLIAILLAAMLLSLGALAQDGAQDAADGSKLPAPEVVAEMEGAASDAPAAAEADAPEDAVEPETAEEPEATDAPETDGEPEADTADAPEATDIPEAESTPEPDAGATSEPDAEATEQPAPETCAVWFEEGFGLSVPGDWLSYPVSDADRAAGIRYALGDAAGANMLYIQFKPTRMTDTDALSEAVESTDGLDKTGTLTFGGTNFVTFIDSRQNASCCATLWGDALAVFAFTPQSDSGFMLTASQLMESFNTL
ncbi:MAG: hypothetical protein IJH86_06875 [Clostridia bacterium]|nr:hypothetical protein [Clostridia bacterium]